MKNSNQNSNNQPNLPLINLPRIFIYFYSHPETALCWQKGSYSQSYGFSSSHAQMWKLDYKQGWALKNWCFWTLVLEKTLESPLDCKEIQPINPKGNQSGIIIVWPPDAKNWLVGKDPAAGKDWRHEENGTTEDEMVGWHHLLDEHKFEQAPVVGDGQGSLACCSLWGHKESPTTDWPELNTYTETQYGWNSLFLWKFQRR